MRKLVIAVALAFAAAGCGGGSDDNNNNSGGSGTFSCEQTTGGMRSCADYSWTGGAYSTTQWNQACMSAGGTAGTGCSHTGAVGGCKLTATSGAVTVNTTIWYYSGTASTFMMACQATNGTWVAP